MIKYTKKSVEVDSVDDVICNKCGQSVVLDAHGEYEWEAIDISHTFGYWSTGRDGDQYAANLCESCYIEFIDTFTVPPEISNYYGDSNENNSYM